MRTLEAWGAMFESDHRAYYTAGGRVWVLDLEPSAGKKKRLPFAETVRSSGRLPAHPAHRRHAGNRRVADVCVARPRHDVFATGYTPPLMSSSLSNALMLSCSIVPSTI